MKLTQKQKLEQFDSLMAEKQKLETALFDLRCGSKFPFGANVRIDAGKEIDGDYLADKGFYRISQSERANPVYMVECFNEQLAKDPSAVFFHTEAEIGEKRGDMGIYWRVLRHGVWKLGRTKEMR